MTTTEKTRPTSRSWARDAVRDHPVLRVVAAALSLAVVYIHVVDQGGLIGDKSPTYIRIGYYLLEVGGVAAAVLLLVLPAARRVQAWLLALGVAAGPILGYVLSRGPGLPSYTDDRGNWSETIGVESLVVEGLLLLLAAAMLGRTVAAHNERGSVVC